MDLRASEPTDWPWIRLKKSRWAAVDTRSSDLRAEGATVELSIMPTSAESKGKMEPPPVELEEKFQKLQESKRLRKLKQLKQLKAKRAAF